MKALSTFIISILFTSALYAQPTIKWQHAYGGSGDEGAYDIKPAVNGGFIFCGQTNSTDGDVVAPGFGSTDYWVCRIDSNGNILWERSYGGEGSDGADVILNVGNGYIIGGNIYPVSDSIYGGEVTGAHGSDDIWVIKTDTAGTLLWQKAYGGSSFDDIDNMKATSDGGYIFVADTHSTDGDITFNHGGVSDIWVVKINDTGKIIWQRCYGGSLNDFGDDIIQTLDGGYLVTAHTSSTDGDMTGITNRGNTDAWLIKIDDTGAIVWQKTYGGSEIDEPNSIIQANDGGYIIGAGTNSSDFDIDDYTTGDGFDVWVYKVDSTGTLLWSKTYGGTGDDELTKIISTTDSNYIFCGSTSSLDGDVTGTHGTNYDYWTVKLNDTGKIAWQKTLGGTYIDHGYAITPCDDSSYIVAGYTESVDGDVTGNHGGSDAWLVRLGYTDTTTRVVTVNNAADIQVYPTLSSGIVYVVVPTGYSAAKISLINTLGQQMPFAESVNGNEHVIDLSGNSTGMYIVRVSYNGVVRDVKVMYRK